ncbi:MAG: ATP-binding protein [Endomicrobiaceae bacterium]|nr:ATP-binding protein [Endomicrobiaceae bacterium]
MLKVSVQSILDGLNDSIHFLQPLYEAIVNSIESESTNINIIFTKDQTLDEEDYKPKVTGFTIIDNGVGFTEDNRNSFTEYLSKYKSQLGCKGIGRFTWLKVFKDIKIESFTKTEKINIDFNESFSEGSVQVTPYNEEDSKTTITLFGVTGRYYNKGKDLRANADLKEIKYAIEKHLMVNFFLWKKEKNKSFRIVLKIDNAEEVIDSDNIIQLNQEEFSVKEEINNTDVNFDLYYNFIDDKKNRHTLFYCADGRTVMQFPEDIRFKNFKDGSSSMFLLTSKYFDERINDVRNEFTFDFKENNPNLTNPLPMPKINIELKNKVDSILIKRYPNLKDENKNIIDTCIDENPHLAKYIRKADIGLIPDKQALLKKATSEFRAEKEKVKNAFVKMLSSNEIDTNEFQENISQLNDICNRELAQYFYYRQNVINALNKLNKEKNKTEKLLHNLFMTMGSMSDKTGAESTVYNTNIWLLDDKYMSYTKMFSDVKIKTIKENIVRNEDGKGSSLKEPDLTIFYNDSMNKKDVVMVEIKAVGTTTDKKMVSITEINRNLGAIAEEIDDIKTLYGYIITQLDDKTKKELRSQQGVFELFAVGNEPIFYYYNGNIKDKHGTTKPCHVYILSTETLYQDANARNKVFLDIVKNTN